MDTLNDKTIAILAASGVEQVELTEPRKAIEAAGGTVVLVSPEAEEVQAYEHDVEPASRFPVDAVVTDAGADDFDALVLPGGTTNPDTLRTDADAMDFVRAFARAGKPIASICHGPWSLVEVDAVRGRTLTSWPSLRTDITNAGGTWVDEEVQVCERGDFVLITSRKPDDLDAFCKTLVDRFA